MAMRSSTPSSASLTSSQHHRQQSTVRLASRVVTTPPWARDEPPSPTMEASVSNIHLAVSNVDSSRPSDVSSLSNQPSRWWSFTSRRPDHPPSFINDQFSNSPKAEKRPFKFPLPPPPSRFQRKDQSPTHLASSQGLTIILPDPPANPFTLSHNITPGWDTPWTSRPAAQGPSRPNDLENSVPSAHSPIDSSHSIEESKNRRTLVRNFILNNTYVPLLFRFVNLSFTIATLVLAVRIRILELPYNALGAVGSSPTLVIIFAPLTIVHVMSAVYLEYFGRPLGLWRTSGKMFHTLLEVVFICAWSAALSLCFDNYFTSPIPCAPRSLISWWSQIPRQQIDLPTIEDSAGDIICEHQLALICLVFTGLLTYCFNLVISLFRIVEKVKYRPNHHGARGWRVS